MQRLSLGIYVPLLCFVALAVYCSCTLLVALVRWGLNRTRYAGWNRDIASLVHDDGGTTNRRR